MITYVYKCGGCAHTFEIRQAITDKSLRKCPECGTMKLRRLITGGVCFYLKPGGVGWAQEGYGKHKRRDR